MGRRGNRQKLSQTLDYAKEDRNPNLHQVLSFAFVKIVVPVEMLG
jgi:hypothetical protein